MFKKFFALAFLTLAPTVAYFALPLVPNPDPNTGRALAKRAFDTAAIEAVWPAPTAKARVRARLILVGEEIIFEDGPTDQIMNTASMRKSFLSLLYGIAVEQGLIDLDKTLSELGIDENPPLTAQEKTATVQDLLMFRSGIYIPAEGEHDSQITERPVRDSHEPGTYFFSNNFDANALGTIFVQETGYEIGDFMGEFLAKPLGMQDFTADNVVMGVPWFMPTYGSQHQMYNMYLSARDTARIGAMVAQGGMWNGVQVVPAAWIEASISPLSDLTEGPLNYGPIDSFGYIWWLYNRGEVVRTDGYGGHLMLIDPLLDITVVERNFSGNSYLSTGLWMMMNDEDKRSNSFKGAVRAREVLEEMLDAG